MTKLSFSNTTTRFGISPKSDDDTVYSRPLTLDCIESPAPTPICPSLHLLSGRSCQNRFPQNLPRRIGAGLRSFLRRIPKLARRRFSGNRRRRDLKQSFNGIPDWLAYRHGRKSRISDLFEYKSSDDSKRDDLFRVPNFAELFDPWGNDYHLKPHRRNRFQQPPCQRRRHLVIASARNLRKTPPCVLPLQPYF